MAEIAVSFDNTYARDLEGFYVDWQPAEVPEPKLVVFNSDLARTLGLDLAAASETEVAQALSGNTLPTGSRPLAQAYAGHQFGGFSPQLGDGRAVLVGEVIAADDKRYDITLKGSGRTPFSRSGDGKATLGPMLREYLISEAMHALGIPTTRGLAVVTTGEAVMRERPLPGAVLTRVASSHLRVGTFQFFAVRRDAERLVRLADYAIARHDPDIADGAHCAHEHAGHEHAHSHNRYLAFFNAVLDRQASLVAKWMLVGFVHGVMNTDNMAISGETIDYGPCAFLDNYDPDAVFSSIDVNGRYAFANQPLIAQWNLTRFAETLMPLVHDDAEEAKRLLTNALNAFPDIYTRHWLNGMRAKLGLSSHLDGDLELVNGLYQAIEDQNVDYTLFFRKLAQAVRGDNGPVRELFDDPGRLDAWLALYESRQLSDELGSNQRPAAMDRVNPLYIPRNHKVEEALSAAADEGDLAPFQKLLDVLSNPFEERPGLDEYAQPAPPDFGPYRTFCGT